MASTRYVGTVKELKQALEAKTDNIIITDKKVHFAAKVIKAINYKSLAAVAGVSAAAGVAFWNPAGWIGGAGAALGGGAVVAGAISAVGGAAAFGITGTTVALVGIVLGAVVVLGMTVLIMHKDYHFEVDTSAGGKVDTTGDKPKADGHASLKVTLKRNGS